MRYDNHTTDVRERVARAVCRPILDAEDRADMEYEDVGSARFLEIADAALEAVSRWFTDNGYLHADGVLGIGLDDNGHASTTNNGAG